MIRCSECGKVIVADPDPAKPRALLGVSITVDYGPPGDGRAGGDLPLCFRCGGGLGQPAAPAAEPEAEAKPAKARKAKPAQVETPPARPAMVVPPRATPPTAAELAAARSAIPPGKR